jgi:FAD:protein FMN transferase
MSKPLSVNTASFFSVVILALVAVIGGCSREEQNTATVERIEGSTMGTTYHVSWAATGTSADTIKPLVDQRLAVINHVMSTYDKESELSIINQGRYDTDDDGWIRISPELYSVLAMSKTIYEGSGHRFDITVGPLVNAWGFGPGVHRDEPLSQEEIDKLLMQVGSGKFELDEQQKRLRLTQRLYLDLSGIAKGWGVDQIAHLLEENGITSYLVEIGGELVTRGKKPDGSAWRIAIERPAGDLAERSVQLILEPGNAGVATSGDYRNYFEKDGVRYSHTIDPSTGRPISHKLASVTVITDNCALADGWATALDVAGPDAALAIAEQQKLAVYLIVRTDDGFKELASSEFNARFPGLLENSK